MTYPISRVGNSIKKKILNERKLANNAKLA